MRNKTIVKWLLANKRDVDLLTGNPYANQLLQATKEWRHAIDKAGPTLSRLEACIRQFCAFLDTPKGRAALAVARDRQGNGHARPQVQRQRVDAARPAARNVKTNSRGRAIR